MRDQSQTKAWLQKSHCYLGSVRTLASPPKLYLCLPSYATVTHDSLRHVTTEASGSSVHACVHTRMCVNQTIHLHPQTLPTQVSKSPSAMAWPLSLKETISGSFHVLNTTSQGHVWQQKSPSHLTDEGSGTKEVNPNSWHHCQALPMLLGHPPSPASRGQSAQPFTLYPEGTWREGTTLRIKVGDKREAKLWDPSPLSFLRPQKGRNTSHG